MGRTGGVKNRKKNRGGDKNRKEVWLLLLLVKGGFKRKLVDVCGLVGGLQILAYEGLFKCSVHVLYRLNVLSISCTAVTLP